MMPDMPLPRRGVGAAWWDDLRLAMLFLTRLPMPGGAGSGNLSRASRAFPLVGVVIGALGSLVWMGASVAGVPPLAAALLAVGSTTALTGGLHEDGLADMADGLGAHDRTHRLWAMGDSRLGTFGVTALVMSVGLRAAALSALGPVNGAAALIATHALSRAAIVPVHRWLPPARAGGLAAGSGRPPRASLIWAVALAGGFSLALVQAPLAVFLALALTAMGAFALARLARRTLGGVTGDVLGAVEQVAEVLALLAFAVMLAP